MIGTVPKMQSCKSFAKDIGCPAKKTKTQSDGESFSEKSKFPVRQRGFFTLCPPH
jgi:hypothetical protein